MLTRENLEAILAAIPHKTVGLVGDLFLDRYLDIDPARDEPSIETGLTAYQVTRVRSYPGALGTVINNLGALGVGSILPVAVIGDDGEGYELQQALRPLPAVNQEGLIVSPERRTPTYTKPMYGDRELNRLDIKNRTPTNPEIAAKIVDTLRRFWDQADAWIVLDQVSEHDCGVVTGRIREELASLAGRDEKKFVLADSRERIDQFRNVCVKPNRQELKRCSLHLAEIATICRSQSLKRIPEPLHDLVPAVMALANLTGKQVFTTDGPNGVLVYDPLLQKSASVDSLDHIEAIEVTGPIDTCGAGDSFSAGLTAAMATGANPGNAVRFANLVASITIQQIGTTGTATPAQVSQRWRENFEK